MLESRPSQSTDDTRPAGSRLHPRREVPAQRALVAAVAPTVVELLATASRDELAESLAFVARRLRQRGEGHDRMAAKRFVASPTVKDAFIQAVKRHVRFAASGGMHAAQEIEPQRYTADHVPQLLWPALYDELFGGWLPVEPLVARTFASIALVKLATGATWPASAEALGLPPSDAGGPVRRAVWAIQEDRNLTQRTHTALRVAAACLSERSDRVDYGRRRRDLAGFDRLDLERWHAACAAHERSYPLTAAVATYGAAWVWAELTVGNLRRSPVLMRTRPNRYPRFERRHMKRIGPILASYATDLERHWPDAGASPP